MQLKWPMRWDLFSLFPAYAGVIPIFEQLENGKPAFPRIRGGDPTASFIQVGQMCFSPHTRG